MTKLTELLHGISRETLTEEAFRRLLDRARIVVGEETRLLEAVYALAPEESGK